MYTATDRAPRATTLLIVTLWALSLGGCASRWKIHGGRTECAAMCNEWGMQLTGMVGVGDQSSTGPGATACVCELPGAGGEAPVASTGAAAGTAAVIVALQEEEQREQEQQRLQQAQQRYY